MFDLLVTSNPTANSGPESEDLAKAIAVAGGSDLRRRIVRLVLDKWSNIDRRVAAIRVAGFIRRSDSAEALMQMIEPGQPLDLQRVAFLSLSRLSGIDDFSEDSGRWRQWWQSKKHLTEEQWLASLVNDFARHRERLKDQSNRLETKLADMQRQLYREASSADRPGLISSFLLDPSESTRLLGLELCGQRVVDGQVIGSDLRDALASLLGHPSTSVRQRAAKLLNDLADETAARIAAKNLDSGLEQDGQVLVLYLQMVARHPQPEIVPKALVYLSDRSLGGYAAGVLTAAIDVGMVDSSQRADAATRLRERIDREGITDAKFVDLLGRVGDENEWRMITAWLDSTDLAVKQAAARAWVDSDQPLGPLVQRVSDPTILPIAIEAARRRGYQRRTFLDLVTYRPQEEQTAQAWERALVAMAGRVAPSVILKADTDLKQRGETVNLRERLVSAAIDRVLPGGANTNSGNPEIEKNPYYVAVEDDPSVLTDLLLLRAEIRLDDGGVTQALADFQRVEAGEPSISSVGTATSTGTVQQQGITPPTLTTAQESRLCLGVVRASLSTGDVESAVDAASRHLGFLQGKPERSAVEESVLRLFVETVEKTLIAGQIEQAERTYIGLRTLVDSSNDPVVTQVVSLLEEKIRQTKAKVEIQPTGNIPESPPTDTQSPKPKPEGVQPVNVPEQEVRSTTGQDSENTQ
jgi:hypothetical protein